MKFASGVFVYIQTFASRLLPFASGIRRRSHSRTRSSSRADAVRSTVSGSALSPKCRPATFTPCPSTYGQPQVRLDAALRREPSGLLLEHALPAIRPLEERVSLAQRGRIEHLVLQVMRPRALERTRDQLAVRIAGVEPAGLGEKGLAALAL